MRLDVEVVIIDRIEGVDAVILMGVVGRLGSVIVDKDGVKFEKTRCATSKVADGGNVEINTCKIEDKDFHAEFGSEK